MNLTIFPFPSPDGLVITDGVNGPTVARVYGDTPQTRLAGAQSLCERYNTFEERQEALQEAAAEGRNVVEIRDLARRLTGTGGITGNDKEAAAQLITEYARVIRLARNALDIHRG